MVDILYIRRDYEANFLTMKSGMRYWMEKMAISGTKLVYGCILDGSTESMLNFLNLISTLQLYRRSLFLRLKFRYLGMKGYNVYKSLK